VAIAVPTCSAQHWGAFTTAYVTCADIAGQCVSFAEVQEAVRLTGQTAIGYIRGSGSGEAGVKSSRDRQRRQAVLGCSASHRVTFGPADRIVVIALVSTAGAFSLWDGSHSTMLFEAAAVFLALLQ
jgi:hypothetical protein